MTDNNFETQTVKFTVVDRDYRLDLHVSRVCGVTRTNAVRMIEQGAVTVDGKSAKKSMIPLVGSRVEVVVPKPVDCEAYPQDIPIDIFYEDNDIIIVNKPQGMVVHPAAGNPDGTLVNALLYHCDGRLSTINGVVRPGIVHRIDKNTSGLLVVAKNDNAHVNLSEQIKEHSFKRVYNAIIIGSFREDEGVINLPIGRNPVFRKKMAVTAHNSKPAITEYSIKQHFKGYSLCEFRLKTGRTHQIRVHSAYYGHAVVGDPLYAPGDGKNPFGLIGQCLHAKTLGLIHPTTGKYMEFEAPIPSHFEKTLEILTNNY